MKPNHGRSSNEGIEFLYPLYSFLHEDQLIQGAQRGDRSCFEELYKRHKTKVFALCLRMTSNHAEAEQCAQEAFLRAYRKLKLFCGYSAFSTWLRRLTINTVLVSLRKKCKGEISLDEPKDATEMPLRKHDATLEDSIDSIALETTMAQLSPGHRIAFVLHDVEGYEHHEIAEMLGWSVETSKSQLSRARLKLRSLLHVHRGNQQRDELTA